MAVGANGTHAKYRLWWKVRDVRRHQCGMSLNQACVVTLTVRFMHEVLGDTVISEQSILLQHHLLKDELINSFSVRY